jgi:hypothetical protein
MGFSFEPQLAGIETGANRVSAGRDRIFPRPEIINGISVMRAG